MTDKAKKESMMDQVKKVGDDAWNAGRKVYLAGLGAVSVTEEETRGMFDRLVTRGEKLEKDVDSRFRKTVDGAQKSAKKVGGEIEKGIQSAMTGVLHRAGVPSRDEIRGLIDRVELLTEKVDSLAASK